jgi:TonB-linked SusC/RagA family outer membrane protein
MRIYFTLLTLLLFSLSARSQTSIEGTVTDPQNDALPGVSVVVKNSTVGTITDIDGNFRLNVPEDAGAIVFSFVGYATQEVDLSGQTTFNITMEEDMLELDEVVKIGSSLTSSRRQLGNAISSVKSEKINQATPTNLSTALQGKLPGAQIVQNSGDPAGGFSVRLRGASTINGSSEPLYVVDGIIISNSTTNVTNPNVGAGEAVPGQNRLVDLNPNDIERMEVINGAAAAAIYGSRASNGVVLITTKKGSTGAPQFTFSTSVNVNQLRKQVYTNLRGEQFGSAEQRLYPIAGTDPETGGLTVGRNFSTDKVPVTRYNYQDDIFQTGLGTDNYFSVRGGSEKTTYFASLSYLKNEGIIRNTDFQRYGVRLRLDNTPADWVKFSLGINYSNSFSNEKPDGNVFWSPINSINITNNIYNASQRNALGNLPAVEPTRVNPVSVIEEFDINQETNRAITSFQANFFPVDGLSIDYIAGFDVYSQAGQTFIPPYPYAGVNPAYFNDGYAAAAVSNVFLFNNDLNATYETQITSDITSTTQAGANMQYSEEDYSLSQGRGLAPFIETVDGASIVLNPTNTISRLRIWGYFVQQSFGLKDRLFLTLAGRVDGASSFSEDNRNQLYTKVSGSYVLSSEPFFQNTGLSSVLSAFKIRASYGQAGNLTVIGPYDRFYRYNPNNLVGQVAINAGNRLANPNVRPERQTELEIGTDLSFYEDRIGITFSYYDQDIEDLVVRRELAASQGGTEITNNIGTMRNRGIELAINAVMLRTNNSQWTAFANFSRNRNVVEDIGQAQTAISNVLGAPAFVVNGEPLGVFFGTYYARNPDGSLLLTPEGLPQQERGDAGTDTPERGSDGQPTGDPLRRVIGDPNPDYILGFGSDFSYKNWNVGFVMESVQGVDVFDADKRTRQGVGIGELSEQELSGELPRGYIWSIYPIQEFRMEDGSFTKLREAYLSYRIDQLGSVLNNVTLTVSGRNLFSIDNFFSYDPEVNAGGQSNRLRGVNFGTVPIPRTYTFTLKANF